MRLFSCLVAVSVPAMLAIGCLTVDADECWVNTSGGLGGSKPIPIGAGVGATSGGNSDSPNGGTSNPCTAPSSPDKGDPPKEDNGQSAATCPPGPADVVISGLAAGDDAVSFCSAACAGKCGSTPHGFSPSVFVFSTTVVDDGLGPAGGWQVATTTLHFYRWTSALPESWECSITVEMPVRAVAYGVIAPQKAGTMTAQVATAASFTVMNSAPDITPGIYCIKLKSQMITEFNVQFPKLGEKVK